VAQLEAQHLNAQQTLNRAQERLRTQSGPQTNVDSAMAAERAPAAQIVGARAQLKTAQINLGYTEIRAPIEGKITSTAVTEGNVVSPSSGTLATVVSQDPMYVIFTVANRTRIDLRDRYAARGGYGAVVIKLRLPDGQMYGQDGKLDYVAPTVGETTDTIAFRGVVANPVFPGMRQGQPGSRELVDGEFVTVLLEGVEPITVLGIPRAAVLSDQQGDYVYVVDGQNKAQSAASSSGSRPFNRGGDERDPGRRTGHQRGAAARPSRRDRHARTGDPAAARAAVGRVGWHNGRRIKRWRPSNAQERSMISAIFVDRPRLAVVIAVVITLAGLLALLRIPVSQFPDIVPPQVVVAAVYPGASAEVVESASPSRSRRRSSASTR
jgi:RND family efflux transporter MFP subunit